MVEQNLEPEDRTLLQTPTTPRRRSFPSTNQQPHRTPRLARSSYGPRNDQPTYPLLLLLQKVAACRSASRRREELRRFSNDVIRRRNKGKVVQGDFVDRSQQGVDDSRIFAEKMDHQRNINRLTRLAWNNPSRGEPNVQRFRRTTVLRYPLVDS